MRASANSVANCQLTGLAGVTHIFREELGFPVITYSFQFHDAALQTATPGIKQLLNWDSELKIVHFLQR